LNNFLSLAAVCLFFGWQTAYCVEVVKVTVDLEDGRYRVFGQSRLDAPPEFVYAALIDYDNFYKLAGGIAATKYLPPDEAGHLLAYTRYESCILFFCKTIEKVERIDGTPNESILAVAIPARSDFVFNESRWLIKAADNATLLTYEAEFDPEFWIPPLIGPWAVRRKLIRSAEVIGMRIEWMHTHGLTLEQVRE